MDRKIEQLAEQVTEVLKAKKASDVVCLDISKKTILADAFIIATGRSNVQVKALCDEVDDFCKNNSIEIGPMEGFSAGRWVIIDMKDIVVHVFHTEDRDFYNLERLWTDAVSIPEPSIV
ncbi:MAG: ribosome silencing factor [Clostridiales bacterium]|nr:ribosome silencing factor [Clostridiales bacterium]